MGQTSTTARIGVSAATSTLHSIVLVVGAVASLASGCTDVDEDYSQITSYATVASYTTSTCSTASVLGLSKQIADEVGCANPTGLVKFAAGGNLVITSNAVLPYLSAQARTSLLGVAATRTVQVNSAFRIVAQQYLLYRWFQLGRCNITAAATPGRSNHESGRALDIQNYSALITPMGAKGWSHDVPGDPVHFDHLASPDIRGRDVLAFQKLWNRNHPNDKLDEDGVYGPMTEARLRDSPSEGFPIGPECAGSRDLDVVAINGPDRVPPQQRAHYAITVKNTGTETWPATTALQLASATSSTLRDESWTSDTVITTLGAPIEAGKTGTIDLDVTTPNTVDAELPVMEALVLNDGGRKFGDIVLALTVVPGMTGEESGDGSEDMHDDGGGCSAASGGGSSGAGVLVLLAWIAFVRRRR